MISFDHVTYTYEGKETPSLRDCTFSVKPGELILLTGESGCGKSSCARTVIRIYEPTAGQIFLDGQEITNLSQRQLAPLRRNIQMVFQDPYASLNARMTVRVIINEPLRAHKVCSNAWEADEMIFEMLDRVGLSREHDNRYAHEFSGGQRQRLAIARALLHDTPVYIFDEAASNVDVESEEAIMDVIRELAAKRTVLIVSHRLANVEDAGCIYVLDGGIVREAGTHGELLELEGAYAKLWRAQRELEEFGADAEVAA